MAQSNDYQAILMTLVVNVKLLNFAICIHNKTRKCRLLSLSSTI